MTPAWLPDWQDSDAYPAPDDLTVNQWRWEFTRRRQDYQDDWEVYAPPSHRQAAEIHSQAGLPVPEGYSTWFEVPFESAEMPESEEKYGMCQLHDPAKPEIHAGYFSTSRTPSLVTQTEHLSQAQLHEEHLAHYSFDLRKPIKPQIENARKHLEETQIDLVGKPDSRRLHKAKLPLYLRVLDARRSGATFEEIGTVVLEDQPGSWDWGPSEFAARAKQIFDAAESLMFNWPR